MSLDDKQKQWITSHSSAKQLTASLNKLLKENKITFVQLDEIYKHFQNFKTDKLL